MAEVLVEYETRLRTRDGHEYRPRACGRVANDGLWEGWLEFLPVKGGRTPVRSGRETEQPNRADLLYWAEGLTQVYLEGALNRALSEPVPATVVSSAAEPVFSGPRPHAAAGAAAPTPRAVLDPFEVYAQGPDVLLRQLAALDVGHLRAIVLAYGLASAAIANSAEREELTSFIMDAVGSADRRQ